MTTSFGIPYAREEFDTIMGTTVKVCPVCDEHVPVRTRKDFESFTGKEYSAHYAANHAEKGPS